MEAVIAGSRHLPAGYRRAGGPGDPGGHGRKAVPVPRTSNAPGKGPGIVQGLWSISALATWMGLLPANFRHLMRDAGFRANEPRPLAEGVFGPPAPARGGAGARRARTASRRSAEPVPTREGSAFAALAGLVR